MNETEEDFLAAALARAQMDARARGFTRSPVPTFVMQGVKGPTPGALVGANEDCAVDMSRGQADLSAESDFSDKMAEAGDLSGIVQAQRHRPEVWVKTPGMAAMHRSYHRSGRINSILSSFVKDNSWSNQIQIASVSNRWPEIVGPNIAEHTHIESFEGKKIVVRCTSTAWAKQLQLLLPEFCVASARLSVVAWWNRLWFWGRWRLRGRKVRCRYEAGVRAIHTADWGRIR